MQRPGLCKGVISKCMQGNRWSLDSSVIILFYAYYDLKIKALAVGLCRIFTCMQSIYLLKNY